MRLRWFFPLLLATCAPAGAETIYKCVGANGLPSYQQQPCAKGQKQNTIQLQDSAPASGQVAPMPAPPPREEALPPPPQPTAPRVPPPRVYACVRATDGKPYTSANGHPDPYLAPFGVLGAVQQPLADVYGPPNNAGGSAPELNRGRVSSTLVANNYVWVQDQCRELSPAEACSAIRDEYDQNDLKLRNAFKSQQGPFEEQAARLKAKLAGCGQNP
ncbi:uncharacterized protein DUF4124 [Luteibacter rhizovicinus]|uniref:Uncharacterized protein DUF4124 n=1 Tax=Luteibacter rhizovicinus TaxID=242606 RepID=A0A4R3YUE9_9GAMM|nr:DUF4124 domain-containing protein [Luteibacter rhizovicinus]TCV96160.1 uncharacterized protein DUF4124 [Luteibacter rhizovicinus]